MNSKKNILFLYTELASYFLACVKVLVQQYNVNAHIVNWPVNSEAPFKFDKIKNTTFYNRNELDETGLKKLVEKLNPNAIITSGWIDKGYLKICKSYTKTIPTVLAIDNHWEGKIKQNIARLISPFTLHKAFNNVWVPGSPQKKYALKLGFKKHQIKTGFYSADVKHFSNLYLQNKKTKEIEYPKRFIYVGRYVEHKGIKELWEAFKLFKLNNKDWELWCLGTGELANSATQFNGIKHFGFVQPNEMENFIKQTGIFILPSKFEPWGVVVHEFAAAGFPIICTNKVGAASEFIAEGKNGFIIDSGSVQSIYNAMQTISKLNHKELIKMGDESAAMAQKITPEIWAKTVINF